MREDSKDRTIAFAIALAVFALFARAIGFEFLREWDDVRVILDNPFYRGFDLARLRWMFTTVEYPPYYIPASWLTWAAGFKLSGMAPWAYHLEAPIYHAVSAALLFALLRMAKLDRFAAGAAALFWAAHPLRAEVVAQVNAKPYAQAAMFALGATLLYALHARARLAAWNVAPSRASGRGLADARPALRIAAIALYVLSLLSHPQGVGLCLAWAAAEIAWRRSARGEAWRPAILGSLAPAAPFMIAAAVVAIVTFAARSATPVLRPPPTLDEFGISNRAAQAAFVTFHYLWKPFVPTGLSPIYVSLIKVAPAAPKFLFAGAAVLAISIATLAFARRNPWPAAVWLSYLFLVAPVWGLKAHPHYVNDRYSYFPHLVLAAALAPLLARALSLRAHAIARVATAALLAALSIASFRQQAIWKDSVTLLNHVLAKLGDDPYRADILPRLSFVRLQRGELDLAEKAARETLATGLNNAMSLRLIAEIQLRSGREAEAYRGFQDLLDLDPKNLDALLAIARIDQKNGDMKKAEYRYEQAIAANPGDPEAPFALANLKLGAKDFPRAVALYQRAIELDPALPDAHNGLGAALASQGRIAEAAESFRRAVELDPNNNSARANLDMAMKQLGGKAR